VNLGQWLFTFVLTAVAGALAVMLTPDGALQRYVRFAAGLIAAAVLIVPLGGLISSVPRLAGALGADSGGTDAAQAQSPSLADKWVLEQSVSELTAKIKTLIAARYGINDCDVHINVDEDNSGQYTVGSIEVDIPAGAAPQAAAIEQYLTGLLGCDVNVGRRRIIGTQ